MTPTDDDPVTVVIPALNEEQNIGSTLRSVRDQDYEALQILVVDGGSSDGTQWLVQAQMAEDSRIELLCNPRKTIPVSLNLALGQAKGRWLVRVDAHSAIPPSYVRTAVSHLRTGSWGGVGGRKDGVGHTAAGLAIAAAMGTRFGVGGSVYHHGTSESEVDHIPFGAYPVALVRELGGWDERLVANEDYEFDFRLRMAGHKLLFDPDLVIEWQCRQSVPDLFRQYHRYGSGKFDVALLHPTSLRLRHLLPPLLIAYFASALVMSTRRPAWSVAMVTPYCAALGVASMGTARTLHSSAAQIQVPGAYLAMHLGWGLGFWSGLVRRMSWPSRARAKSTGDLQVMGKSEQHDISADGIPL